MLFKVFTVFCACFLLCHAEPLKRYNSQTVSELVVEATDKFPVCKCSGSKCQLDEKAAEQACKALKERFRYFAYPSGYLMLCEFQPKSCTELANGKPKHYYIHAIYDAYYLRTSPIYLDDHSPTRLLSQRFVNDPLYQHPLFLQKIVASSIKKGQTGMPLEFDGELSIPVKDTAQFDLCYDGECHKIINSLCESFEKSLKEAIPKVMQHYIGCHVKHIYKKDNQLRVTWAMMLYYWNVRESGAIKTTKDLADMSAKIEKSVKPPSILKSFKLIGVHPLDFCEITATTSTTLKSHHYMEDATSNIYQITKAPLYFQFWKQLTIGDSHHQSCLRNILATRLDQDKGSLKVTADLWVSFTCFKKRGLKTCAEVTKEIENIWKNGSALAYNPWTPNYSFKLTYQGRPLDA